MKRYSNIPEECCVPDMAFHALTLAPDATPPALALSEKHFLRKHGATATYGQKKS